MWQAKQGVDLSKLRPEITRLEPMISACYEAFHAQCVVTATDNGKHLPNSFHYKHAAVDLRVHQFAPLVQHSIWACIKRQLDQDFPGDYDLLLEAPGTPNGHLHLEPSPKLAAAMFPKEASHVDLA